MKRRQALVILSLVAMLVCTGTVGVAATSAARSNTALFENLGDAIERQQDQHNDEDSIASCARNWSLYNEHFGHRNYDMAYEPWRYMFEHCPQATLNIYLHGDRMIMFFYNDETDPSRRDAWVDTLMLLYDRRIEMFGDEGHVLGRKATRLYQLRPTDVQELYELSERSIELEGMNSSANVLVINLESVIRLANAALLEPDAIIEAFDRATDIIEYNLEHNPEDARFYNPARNNIRSIFEPYATCESLAQVFGPRIDANPEDVELLQRITEMLENAGCINDDLFYHATLQLHIIHPNAESAFLMGRLDNARENYRRAIEFFQQAADLYSEEGVARNRDRIFRAYWLMAEISYRQFHELQQARGYARQAHQTIPDDGRPLILIGEMYAASASECGDDDVAQKAAYWAAVDKFIEARNVTSDEIVKERAQQMTDTYLLYFPNNEEIFFHGYSEGETYRVECWIKRTTRIRAR